MKLALLTAAAAAALALPAAAAQNAATIDAARRAGAVGERYDGYMGFVAAPSAELRRQVSAVNLRRRNLYIQLAGRRSVEPSLVGFATACELIAGTGPGDFYQLADGVWRRRVGGQPAALPDYCGK